VTIAFDIGDSNRVNAKKSSDLSAMVVELWLVQIRDLQRCAGAKVGGDLLAGEISAVGILLLCPTM
jgi:hypothetical protein